MNFTVPQYATLQKCTFASEIFTDYGAWSGALSSRADRAADLEKHARPFLARSAAMSIDHGRKVAVTAPLSAEFCAWLQSHGIVTYGIQAAFVEEGWRGIAATEELSAGDLC